MLRDFRSLARAFFLLSFLLVGNDLTAQGSSTQLSEEALQLQATTGVIHATLLLPGGAGPRPVALIIAGSGPTDRNGNNAMLPGPNNSLKLLAEGLAQRGIASVRYDKRGIAASAAAAPREADLRFDTYVDDAVAWVRRLQSDARFSSVSVIGHSEGSLIGMRASSIARPSSFVSIAGIARPAAAVIRDQLRPQLPPDLWSESERILASLEAGKTADSVPPALAALYRMSVQPYVISWFAYNPTQEIARLTMPVLIAQGTTDIQVGVTEANALHAAKPDAELLLVEGMNHVLKSVPSDPVRQMASYSEPSLSVIPELIERVSSFINAASRSRVAP